MPVRLERLQRGFVRSATFAADPDFAASVAGGGKLSAAGAVEVYRRGYPARLTEALGETFEACWRVMGDADFLAACAEYVARTPSRSYNLSDYGETFPDFLALRADETAAPFLGDLARFEWAFKELFHAAPRPGAAPAELASAARPDAALRLAGPVVLLSLAHRVYGLWKRDRADETPLSRADWEGAQRLALYKSGGNPVFVRELSAPEHAALSALAAGRTVEDALADSGLDEGGAAALFAFLAGSRLVAGAR
jgi:hypothetical protein